MNETWAVLLAINCMAAFFGLILFVTTSTKTIIKKGLRCLPRTLRFYLITCAYPSAVILALTSIITSIVYIFFEDSIDYTIFKVLLAFTSMQFRFCLLAMMVERIIATIYLEKYCKYSSNPIVLIFTIAISYCCSLLYIFFLGTWVVLYSDKHVIYVMVTTALIMHALILIIIKVLHSKNKKMYKLLAYRVSLKQRYQIVENIKVLNFLYPKIFIFSIFAPMGPLVTLIYRLSISGPEPLGLYHWSYNVSFVLIMGYRLIVIHNRRRIRPVTGVEEKVLAIISPLGKQLPVNIPIDQYFENLQRQWK